jgi:hypothetical protein
LSAGIFLGRLATTLARARFARVLVVLALLVFSASAFARPGGGQSYRGGSSRSSGGGGYSGGSSRSSGGGGYSGGGYSTGESLSPGAAIFVLFIIICVVVVMAAVQKRGGGQQNWSTYTPQQGQFGQAYGAQPYGQGGNTYEVPTNLRADLEQLRSVDPNFSLVVFDDFVSALYTEILLAQGRGTIERYSPYLGPAAKATLMHRPLQGLSVVLVGSVGLESVDGIDGPADISVVLNIEANLSRRDAQGQEQALYVQERWTLARKKLARSRTPDKARVFGCPNCTAPLENIFGGMCKHCGQNVATGAFDWMVTNVFVMTTEQRGPMLTGNTEEQGTHLPTNVDPNAHGGFAAIQTRDPAFQWDGFAARANHIFTTFQHAWSNRDLSSMRPYLSDALFATQGYWVTEYLRQRLRNVSENARIGKMELARASEDAFFDTVTIRLFASSLDYTLSDANQQIVSGSRSNPRNYSEYWTFIRSRAAKGPSRVDPNCPRCGAPLNVNMGGNCTYCQAKVTSGDFDWVLSRIEQDEAYQG